jgi:segregation and condensation protein B
MLAVIPAEPTMDDLSRHLEALLFIAPRPVPAADLAASCERGEDDVSLALAELAAEYADGRHGIVLREVGGGFTLAVADDCAETVRRHAGLERPEDLSPALLETLSVVAYLEPVTRADVAEVRGVSSEWALAGLVERGLVEEQGRAATPGAPILYATTGRFLKLFGLRSRAELPPLEEFALEAGEVEEIRARLLGNAARRRP